MSITRYLQYLLEKAIRCGLIIDEVRLKSSFIEGLHYLVNFCMKTYWGAHKDEIFQNLARYAISLLKLKKRSNSISTPSQNISCDPGKLKTYSQISENSLFMSVQDHRGSKSSSISSSKTLKTKRQSSNKEKS